MIIIRKKFKFTNLILVPYSICQDKRLSIFSKGLLMYLFGLKDNWKDTVSKLAEDTNSDKDQILASLGQLKKYGFLLPFTEEDRNKKNVAEGLCFTELCILPRPLDFNLIKRHLSSPKDVRIEESFNFIKVKFVYNIILLHLDYYSKNNNNLSDKEKKGKKKYSEKKKNRFEKDSDEYILAEGLFKLIQQNKPSVKVPNMQRWASDIDLLLRIDKRDVDLVARVIEWSQSHTFWRRNILSPGKLRSQFDRLELEMEAMTPDEYDKLLLPLAINSGRLFCRRFSRGNFDKLWKSNVKFKDAMFRSAERISEFCEDYQVKEKQVILLLLDCLDSYYRNNGKPVVPGHFCSSNTWDILFPQFLSTRINLTKRKT